MTIIDSFASAANDPCFARLVPIKFEAILIRIAQIQGLTDSVVARTGQLDAGRHDAVQRICQSGARRIEDRGVEKTGGARRRRRTAFAFQVLSPM